MNSPPGADACCRRCGYVLQGLPKERCPECGTEFDSTDRDSYTTQAVLASRKFRRTVVRVIIVGVVVCAALIAAVCTPAVMRAWYEKEVRIEYCSSCGLMRETDLERPGFIASHPEQTRTIRTCVSDLYPPCPSHSWCLAGRLVSDFYGREKVCLIENLGVLRLCQNPPQGSLETAVKVAPDLAAMISRDILQPGTKSNAIGEWCLRQMAEDSTPENVQKWIAQWRDLSPPSK